MGLSASSYNLLRYTRRKNDIGRQLTQLSLQKMSLTRDVQALTREYQNSMNSKILKWTNNAGADYFDLSYSLLMTPGTLNNSKLNMITDQEGRIVVDKNYLKYAEMISPNGAPGGDYESNRSDILSQLLGIAPSDIDRASNAYESFLHYRDTLNDLVKPEKTDYKFCSKSMSKLLDKNPSYSASEKVTSQSELDSFISSMTDLSKYFLDDAEDYIKKCDKISETTSSQLEHLDGEENPKYPTQKTIATSILASLNYWYDIDDPSYEKYLTDYEEWKAESDAAEEGLQAAMAVYNSVYDSDARAKVDFYDELFSSIADNGWNFYEKVSDPEYLNNMFQNSFFNIMTVDRECTKTNHGYTYKNNYTTDPALTCKNIVQVNDADRNNQAFIEYEHKKDRLNEKENRLDIRMKNLETEQSAVKQMIESVKNIMNNNIEQHFNIFSA